MIIEQTNKNLRLALKVVLLFLVLFFCNSTNFALSNSSKASKLISKPHNFREAKIVARKLFDNNTATIYSGCKISNDSIDFNTCEFKPNPKNPKDLKIEFEHVFPMSYAKHHFACWREPLCMDKHGDRFKGRKCCALIDPAFMGMEAELYNLFLEIGTINRARGNFQFTQFSNLEKLYLGKYRSSIFIDFVRHLVEPRDEVKGMVARANLFMAKKYHLKLSRAQRKLFNVWNKQYPPTEIEKAYANKVAAIVGYENEFISKWGLINF